MKIMVIGGTGVISTAVARQFVARGDDVTLVNRGRTPVRVTGRFEVLIGDRQDRPAFDRLLRGGGPWDVVIDMICSDPDDALLLSQAVAGRAGQVIFCSTTNVYPKPADAYPVREDHRLGAAFKNGVDKAACEAIHRDADQAGHYRMTILRPGHTFGEGGWVLHSLGNGTGFLDRIRHGRPIVVHGDGQGLWSALHACDVAAVFAAAAGNPIAMGRTFNATGVQWMTWDQYVSAVAAALDAPLPLIVHVPTEMLARLAPDRAAQCLRSLRYPGVYDMTAARRDLGFEPRVTLVDGLRRTIQWIEANGGIDPWSSDEGYEQVITRWQAVNSAVDRGGILPS